jgi:precorrin-2 dehydrogenase/sirohydrochlorin ferrochelatase
MDPNYFPVFLQLKNKLCVVVGGGDVASRKVASLLECAALVRVVSPAVSSHLEHFADNGRIELCHRAYEQADVLGAGLVIAATNNVNVNRQVAQDCEKYNIPVNVVDDPNRCDFIVPAVIRRGPLTLAISTGGTLPAMARKIRETLEGQFDHSFGELLVTLGQARTRVLATVDDPAKRKRIFTTLATEDLLSILRERGEAALEERISQIIHSE